MAGTDGDSALARARAMQREEAEATVIRQELKELQASPPPPPGDEEIKAMLKQLKLLERERGVLLKDEIAAQLWNGELMERIANSPPPADFWARQRPQPTPPPALPEAGALSATQSSGTTAGYRMPSGHAAPSVVSPTATLPAGRWDSTAAGPAAGRAHSHSPAVDEWLRVNNAAATAAGAVGGGAGGPAPTPSNTPARPQAAARGAAAGPLSPLQMTSTPANTPARMAPGGGRGFGSGGHGVAGAHPAADPFSPMQMTNTPANTPLRAGGAPPRAVAMHPDRLARALQALPPHPGTPQAHAGAWDVDAELEVATPQQVVPVPVVPEPSPTAADLRNIPGAGPVAYRDPIIRMLGMAEEEEGEDGEKETKKADEGAGDEGAGVDAAREVSKTSSKDGPGGRNGGDVDPILSMVSPQKEAAEKRVSRPVATPVIPGTASPGVESATPVRGGANVEGEGMYVAWDPSRLWTSEAYGTPVRGGGGGGVASPAQYHPPHTTPVAPGVFSPTATHGPVRAAVVDDLARQMCDLTATRGVSEDEVVDAFKQMLRMRLERDEGLLQQGSTTPTRR